MPNLPFTAFGNARDCCLISIYSSSIHVFSRLTVSSLEILNGRPPTKLLLKMETLMNTWVKFQRFHGLCQRSHLHQRPLDSTGRRKSRTIFRLMIQYLCLTFVICRVTISINCIQGTPNAEGIHNVLGMESSSQRKLLSEMLYKLCSSYFLCVLRLV